MQMRRQDSAIHGITQTVAARDAEIARLQHELHGTQLRLQAVQQELQTARHESLERNSQIAQLAAQVAQGAQHARELKTQLVIHATRIGELERSETLMQTSRAEAEQVMQARIRGLDEEVRRREESLAEVRESTSWKVTAPLRAVGRLLK
jgi:chromosome segregation ATPase